METITPTEMGTSYIFLVDLEGRELFDDEIEVKVNGNRDLVISYNYDWGEGLDVPKTKTLDLPANAIRDAVSAVLYNGTLIVSVNKEVNERSTSPRCIRVMKK
ncbi:hypothetical protein MKW92_042614 [Papaver armeniacum]|nr:hypothetical protein MKW92_042614 [Papaver armeniacum]